jgi:predicted lysophospholipase L1 biosynthesis ABC-type transport system permease subunit
MYFRCGLWFSIKNAFFMIFQSKIVKNRPQMYLLTEIHDLNGFGLGTARTFDVDCGFR